MAHARYKKYCPFTDYFFMDVAPVMIGLEFDSYTIGFEEGAIFVCAVVTNGPLSRDVTVQLNTSSSDSETSGI